MEFSRSAFLLEFPLDYQHSDPQSPPLSCNPAQSPDTTDFDALINEYLASSPALPTGNAFEYGQQDPFGLAASTLPNDLFFESSPSNLTSTLTTDFSNTIPLNLAASTFNPPPYISNNASLSNAFFDTHHFDYNLLSCPSPCLPLTIVPSSMSYTGHLEFHSSSIEDWLPAIPSPPLSDSLTPSPAYPPSTSSSSTSTSVSMPQAPLKRRRHDPYIEDPIPSTHRPMKKRRQTSKLQKSSPLPAASSSSSLASVSTTRSAKYRALEMSFDKGKFTSADLIAAGFNRPNGDAETWIPAQCPFCNKQQTTMHRHILSASAHVPAWIAAFQDGTINARQLFWLCGVVIAHDKLTHTNVHRLLAAERAEVEMLQAIADEDEEMIALLSVDVLPELTKRIHVCAGKWMKHQCRCGLVSYQRKDQLQRHVREKKEQARVGRGLNGVKHGAIGMLEWEI